MVNVCLNVSLLNLEVFPINQFFLSHFQNFSLESSYNLSKYVIRRMIKPHFLNKWIYFRPPRCNRYFRKKQNPSFLLYHENHRLNNDEVILVWRRSWKPPKVSILTRFRHFSRHLLILLWEQKSNAWTKIYYDLVVCEPVSHIFYHEGIFWTYLRST